MDFRDLIARKRDGGALAPEEWERFVAGVTAGKLPKYQLAAFLMAAYIRGLNDDEVAALTRAMAASGTQLRWGPGPYVDKHSTGGVGDAVTLVAAPWAAACGARVPKLSGRGLSFTGGTIDKLGAIPGIKLTYDAAAFAALVDRVGWAVAEATALAPADKVLYALRDATATVGAVPLIVASIMSKKVAAGAPGLVFDVKCGRGAFAADEKTARDLAGRLVQMATAFDRKAVAVITAMDQPLGYAVGNALEVEGAAAALEGKGAPDLVAVARAVAAEMLAVAGVAVEGRAEDLLTRALETGRAYAKFDEMARAQGADADWRARLPRAAYQYDVRANATGTLTRLDAYGVAKAAAALGAARATVEDALDASAGVVLVKKEGDDVKAGECVMTLHYNDARRLEAAVAYAKEALTVGEEAEPRPLIIDILR